MYVNGIQCDTCTKILNVNMAVFSHGDVPQDWISAKKGKGDLLHFCSLHCLDEWVQKQMVVYPATSDDSPLMPSSMLNESQVKNIVPDEYWRDL